MPLILVIIDGYTNLKGIDGGEEYFITFQDHLREGTGVGVRYLLSCNHSNEAGSMAKQELDYRLALQAKDRYIYGEILDAYIIE